MAKIDVSTIEGFEGMSAEQKVEALMKIEVPEKVDMSGFIAKSQFDKTASELADAKKAIAILGGKVEKVENAQLEDFGLDHRIIFIKKVKNTPAKYPRKAGTPAKEPLK